MSGCVTQQSNNIKERKFYSSLGFALIYDDNIFKNGEVDRKMANNDEIAVMHTLLKTNTPVKIINPETSKFIETKIFKRANYPKLFNIVLSKRVATILELDTENPYVEVLEIKKNKTFIAKEGTIFDEEKNVIQSAPVDEIKMDDLSKKKSENQKNKKNKKNFFIHISDFYYDDSATNLKIELIKKSQINTLFVEKINDNKYRLSAGPFKNFNSLKLTYISLNNLGFEDLNIYKE